MEDLLGQMFGIGTILHLDDENKFVFFLYSPNQRFAQAVSDSAR